MNLEILILPLIKAISETYGHLPFSILLSIKRAVKTHFFTALRITLFSFHSLFIFVRTSKMLETQSLTLKTLFFTALKITCFTFHKLFLFVLARSKTSNKDSLTVKALFFAALETNF